jgi:hypothetical protein
MPSVTAASAAVTIDLVKRFIDIVGPFEWCGRLGQ